MLSSIAQPGEISEVVEHLMRGCFPYAVTENQASQSH